MRLIICVYLFPQSERRYAADLVLFKSICFNRAIELLQGLKIVCKMVLVLAVGLFF